MFFILSKTLYFIAMPITWLLSLLVAAIVIKHPRHKKRLLWTTLGVLVILTNPFIINELYLLWETPPTPFRAVGQYDIGIVLTGYTNAGKSPKDRVYMNESADRLLYAIRLYKEGKLKKILICGREIDWYDTEGEVGEDFFSKHILLQAGIPPTDILEESQSKNTRENAAFAKKALANVPSAKLLLITSAFHMRRAKGCFQQAGLSVDTFSANYYSRDRVLHPITIFAPSEDALNKWGRLVHEIIGYVVYKIMGYC